MRFTKGLLVGLVATGLVACSSPGSGLSAAPAKSVPAAGQLGPFEPKTHAGARAAAARFYGLYFGSQFAASWDLLAPAAKRHVPRSVWVGVHDGCLSSSARRARVIKSVTVFGDAAIVTNTIAGSHSRHRTASNVFNYANGRWGYSPADLSIYHHGSVAADIAAAKAAGFCTSRKNSML